MQILLIEADRHLQQQIKLVLQSGGGFDVISVSSPEQAMPVLLNRTIDLAFGREDALRKMPVQIAKVGFGAAPTQRLQHCLGWIEPVHPLPGLAEKVRQLWQRYGQANDAQ